MTGSAGLRFRFTISCQVGQGGGGAEYQDVRAAGIYLQSLREIDAERVGLYGGSHGGCSTAMASARDSALFNAGVEVHGVHDWAQAFGLKELFTRKHYESPADARQALGTGWKSPVLFIAGDDDRNVRVRQTGDTWRRLRDTRVHQETLILAGETHGPHRHSNVFKANAATAAFLERFLGDQVKKR